MNSLTSGKLIAYLAFIFVAGGVTGAVITANKSMDRDIQAQSLEKTCSRIQDRLRSRLDLTQAQFEKLRPVFDQTAQELRSVHGRAICEMDGIIRKAHQRIALELNPDQKIKLERYDAERQRWLQRKLKGHTNWTSAEPPRLDAEPKPPE